MTLNQTLRKGHKHSDIFLTTECSSAKQYGRGNMQIAKVAMGYYLSMQAARVICHLICHFHVFYLSACRSLSFLPLSLSLSLSFWLHSLLFFMNILFASDLFNPVTLPSTAHASTHKHAHSVYTIHIPVQRISPTVFCSYSLSHTCTHTFIVCICQ